MTDLRKIARDKPCMVRIPGVCNGDSATTVLAHLRMAGITGTGLKAPDLLGAWACSDCHSYVDSNKEEAHMHFFEGMARTQYQLTKLGVVKW